MYKDLQDPKEIQLDRHSVIEASAGSGKTYTLERIVLRLLEERTLNLDAILLVTFTEKAAGELKDRIRDSLQKHMQDTQIDASLRMHLRRQYEDFDQAKIYTIHGFCNYVLKEFAFENSTGFSYELAAADTPIYRAELFRLFRTILPETFAEELPFLLEICGVNDLEIIVTDIANKFQAIAHDTFKDAADNPEKGIRKDMAACTAFTKSLASIDTAPLRAELEAHGEKLNSYEKNKKKYCDWMLEAIDHPDYSLECINSIQSGFKKASGVKSLTDLFKHVRAKEKDADFTACLEAAAIFDSFDLLKLRDRMRINLISWLVYRVQEQSSLHKEARGLISYQDMLALVFKALQDSKTGTPLVQRLREQFSYGLIDEFQDTDLLQWGIFRRIFVEEIPGLEPRTLCVVGDPKQSIYGFRGADVQAYLEATRELSDLYGGVRYNLPRNWRSRPMLIEAWNTLFKGWEFEKGVVIAPMSPPEADKLRCRCTKDASGRAAISAVKLNTAPHKIKAGEARTRFCAFVASEVARLLEAPALHIPDALQPNNIAVLVARHKDAILVEQSLREAGIDCTIYKKGGLYQSTQARELLYMLEAVAEPDSARAAAKAALTGFFCTAADTDSLKSYIDGIASIAELGAAHSFSQALHTWHGMALKREWPRLFSSLLEESGLIYRTIGKAGADRALSNWYHLMENMQQLAAGENLDIQRLVTALANSISGCGDASEDLHRLESERPKVQIMTIHASKGLEFPVVFLATAPGTKSLDLSKYYRYHEGSGFAYDLTKSADGKARQLEEMQTEHLRLMYVAMTRAIYKLYVPYYTDDDFVQKPSNVISRDLAPAIESMAADDESLLLRVIDYNSTGGDAAPDIDSTSEDAQEPQPDGDLIRVTPPLCRRATRSSLQNRIIRIASYTALAHNPAYTEGSSGDAVFDDSTILPEKAPAEHPFIPELNEDFILPRGPKTGLMLHDVFEKADFSLAARYTPGMDLEAFLAGEGADLLTLIKDAVQRRRVRPVRHSSKASQHTGETEPAMHEQRMLLEIARMVLHTLLTPLDMLAPGFRLADLDAGSLRHEVAFYFTGANDDSFITGYIDMVFEHNNKVYILDWKSNCLESYSRDALEEEMQRNNYHLQYELYALALCRWMAASGRPFEDIGGILYLFARGIHPDKGDAGVYFSRLNRAALEARMQTIETAQQEQLS